MLFRSGRERERQPGFSPLAELIGCSEAESIAAGWLKSTELEFLLIALKALSKLQMVIKGGQLLAIFQVVAQYSTAVVHRCL